MHSECASSVPLRRARIDAVSRVNQYPAPIPQGSTGIAVSVSAPFKLDADRTSLLNSTWNDWLAEPGSPTRTGPLIRRLAAPLWRQWYLALDGEWLPAPVISKPRSPRISVKRHAGLPRISRQPNSWQRQPSSSSPWKCDEISSTERYLDRRLAENGDAIDFALRNGARRFTLNSLVRLRCAGPDASNLSTKLGKQEANYHFPGSALALADVDRQQQMAHAITTAFRRRSNQNRKDLRKTAQRCRRGSLRPPQKLVRVDKSLWEYPNLLPRACIRAFFTIKTSRVSVARSQSTYGSWRLRAALPQGTSKTLRGRRSTSIFFQRREARTQGAAAVRRIPSCRSPGNWVAPEDLHDCLPRRQHSWATW